MGRMGAEDPSRAVPAAPLILKPETVGHGGFTVAREDGKVWLLGYALPGEVVEAEPRGRQGGVAVATTSHVIES